MASEMSTYAAKISENLTNLAERATNFSFALGLSSFVLALDLSLSLTTSQNITTLGIDEFQTDITLGYVTIFLVGYAFFMSYFTLILKHFTENVLFIIFLKFNVPTLPRYTPSRDEYIIGGKLLKYAQDNEDELALHTYEKELKSHNEESEKQRISAHISFSCLLLIIFESLTINSGIRTIISQSYELLAQTKITPTTLISTFFLTGIVALIIPWIYEIFTPYRTLWIWYPKAAKATKDQSPLRGTSQ